MSAYQDNHCKCSSIAKSLTHTYPRATVYVRRTTLCAHFSCRLPHRAACNTSVPVNLLPHHHFEWLHSILMDAPPYFQLIPWQKKLQYLDV